MNVTYDYGEPYDPDMTVQEALSKGLIAVIDSGAIGPGYRGPCDYEGPWDRNTSAGVAVRCTRSKGHDGVHAHVVRWQHSYYEAQEAHRRLEEASQESKMKQEAHFDSLKGAAKAVEKSMDEMRKTLEKVQKQVAEGTPSKKDMVAEDKRLNRIAAQSYSPMDGNKKNARFRDKGAGKVRGR